MPTHVIKQLQAALWGFNVVPFMLKVGGKSFEFSPAGKKVKIMDLTTREVKIGSTEKLLKAFLKDAGVK